MLPSLISRRTVAIDIGANIGLYAFRMSKLFSKVYAFEVNGDVTGDLTAYNSGNIDIRNVGLSSKSDHAILYIPVLRGFPLLGWASLAPGNCPDTAEFITKSVEVQTLDSFNLDQVAFIKIDVEGHELEVLRGARRTLTDGRPTVLVEIQAQNREAVFQFFSEINYAHQATDELIREPSSPQNYVFVHRDDRARWPGSSLATDIKTTTRPPAKLKTKAVEIPSVAPPNFAHHEMSDL